MRLSCIFCAALRFARFRPLYRSRCRPVRLSGARIRSSLHLLLRFFRLSPSPHRSCAPRRPARLAWPFAGPRRSRWRQRYRLNSPSAAAQSICAGAGIEIARRSAPQAPAGTRSRQALAMLDEHRARFGANGALEPEANVTRIEALLRLGRHDQALGLLDGLALTTAGVGREMLVARAELRAEKGRRAAALNDFNLLLSADAPPDVVSERALYGRATCRRRWATGQGRALTSNSISPDSPQDDSRLRPRGDR